MSGKVDIDSTHLSSRMRTIQPNIKSNESSNVLEPVLCCCDIKLLASHYLM